MKRLYEKHVLEERWVREYCWGDRDCVRYALEEQGKPHPDWMLPDGSLDEHLRIHVQS